MYRDESIKVIFDISGGDLANMVLPYLDYNLIEKSDKQFWGYSDLTTIINAIYSKTGAVSTLYQIRNLIYKDSREQIERFSNSIFGRTNELFDFPYVFVQGEKMEGVVVGGNIRCLLKLAGTEYFPDMQGKILLLESLSGGIARILTFYSQLEQLGVFKKVNGILLGTFSEIEEEGIQPNEIQLLEQFVKPDMPIVKTKYIGHGTDSMAIEIGRYHYFQKEKMMV